MKIKKRSTCVLGIVHHCKIKKPKGGWKLVSVKFKTKKRCHPQDGAKETFTCITTIWAKP